MMSYSGNILQRYQLRSTGNDAGEGLFLFPRGTLENGEVSFLQISHIFFFFLGFVAVAAQMKGAVENHPKKLLAERHAKCPGIFPDPVGADVDLAGDGLTRIGYREGYNIRIIIML